MKEAIIKVVILESRTPARVEVIRNELETFQKIVGGYIECVKQQDHDILINEEGKLLELTPNFGLYNGDYIAGTAVFVGVDYKHGEFKSLSDEQIENIQEVFIARRGKVDKTN